VNNEKNFYLFSYSVTLHDLNFSKTENLFLLVARVLVCRGGGEKANCAMKEKWVTYILIYVY